MDVIFVVPCVQEKKENYDKKRAEKTAVWYNIGDTNIFVGTLPFVLTHNSVKNVIPWAGLKRKGE